MASIIAEISVIQGKFGDRKTGFILEEFQRDMISAQSIDLFFF